MSDLAPLSPRRIAEHARAEAKSPGIPNTTAILLVLAAKAIDQSLDRTVRLATLVETVETECELLRKVCYGSQKGGAA